MTRFVRCVPPTATAQRTAIHRIGGQYRVGKSAVATESAQTFDALFAGLPKWSGGAVPVVLSVTATWPHLTSVRGVERNRSAPHVGRLDCDNWVKAAQDSLARLGVIPPDHLVVDLHVRKRRGPFPGIEITVEAWSQ